MIVLTLSKCPEGLKGDVTKWLMEINTGVFVGKLNARVRDLLWERVCKYCGSGEAIMVYSARNEQGFAFYVYNTVRRPVDLDGMLLIKAPLPVSHTHKTEKDKVKKDRNKKIKTAGGSIMDISLSIVEDACTHPTEFVSIDIETTGLKSGEDSIIEIAAVRYVDGEKEEQFSTLIKSERKVPEEVVRLTGISEELLIQEGTEELTALEHFIAFIGNSVLIGHYIKFDIQFLEKACARNNLSFGSHQVVDTIVLTKNNGKKALESYSLENIVRSYGIAEKQEHRALPDALLAAEVYLKLTED